MQRFTYKALGTTGRLESGVLEAGSMAAALQSLERMRIIPVQVIPADSKGALWRPIVLGRGKTLSGRDLLGFTQGLASLLKAGVPLDRALGIMRETSDRLSIGSFCSDLERRIREGESLTGALNSGSERLPSYYIPMIQAGERGGSLPESLERLAAFMQRAAAVRERIISSLIYPAMLAGMILVTLTLVLTVVLPRFRSLFQESQAQLPLATRVVLALGDMVKQYGWIGALAAGAGFAFCVAAWRHPVHGGKLSRWLLTTPWTLGLIGKLQTSRFLRTIGSLTRSGVPVPEAAGIALGMLENRALYAAGAQVCTRLRAGQTLSNLLAEAKLFPATAIQLVRVGEESGELGALLTEASDVLDRECQSTIDRLLSVIVPATTLLMGALVAALIGSVLVGILSLNDLAF